MSTITLQEALQNLLPSNTDETLSSHLLDILEDKSSTLEDVAEDAAPYFVELGISKDEAEAAMKIESLLEERGYRRRTIKKLDVPFNIKPTEEQQIIKKTKNFGNTFDAVLSLEADVDAPKKCVDIEEFIKLTFDPNPFVRKKALRELCPCHVKKDIDRFWERTIEMVTDPDERVRYQVLHNLCDGSPLEREAQIIEAIEKLHYDDDKKVRRVVNQVLSHYHRTGKWNIL
eukprot:TRINITY_DN3829_c0_g1_i3.p1 TRINITY_DN3829_c0_g1~~TRINITY_DN3829_c0_g1_i3.p1  ORF type:complete len:230 (+),score=48.99 TRINITY_DN3829_c0_g1_i3:87-776(+)